MDKLTRSSTSLDKKRFFSLFEIIEVSPDHPLPIKMIGSQSRFDLIRGHPSSWYENTSACGSKHGLFLALSVGGIILGEGGTVPGQPLRSLERKLKES